MSKFLFSSIVAAGLSVGVSLSALAQEPVQGVLEACESEITTYCDQVTPGHGRMISCMYAHEDKISDGCAASIVDLADAIDHMFATVNTAVGLCAADIESNCSNVEFGGGRILSCLKANEATLSADCKPVVGAFSERFGLTD